MSHLLDQVIVFRIFATNFAWPTQLHFLQELQLRRKLCWMLFLFHTQSALFRAALFVLVISDHDLIYIARKQRLPRPNVRSIEYRSMKNFDEPAFLSSLSDIPWDTAYTFDDVNDIWCHWESLLKQAIDHHAPLKRVNLKSNHLPWINPAIQNQRRIRNLLYEWKLE